MIDFSMVVMNNIEIMLRFPLAQYLEIRIQLFFAFLNQFKRATQIQRHEAGCMPRMQSRIVALRQLTLPHRIVQHTAIIALLVRTMRATASFLGGLFCRLFTVFLRLDVDDHRLF